MDEQVGHVRPEAGSSAQAVSREPHEMRITDHGKIYAFVAFALKFLQENPQRPLVFHTFPYTEAKPTPKPCSGGSVVDDQFASSNQEAGPQIDEAPKKRRKLAATTATIPRLVTVVEIVKREYGKWAAARKVADGEASENSLRMGLHQYNELSCLEELGILKPQEQEPDEAEQLRLALEGKSFLKQKFTPHLKVTLSVHALPELEETGATHQPPLPTKRSKSAKARERKRTKKREAENSK